MKMNWIALLLLLAPALRAEDVPAASTGTPVVKYAWKEEWPRFRPIEYAVTGAALAGAAANFYLVPPPHNPVWRGPIFFDERARGAMLIGSEAGRDKVKVAADLLVIPLMGYAMLDGPVVALWAGNKDTAFQLAMINAETFAVAEFLNLSITNLIPRTRPAGAVCDPESKYDKSCVKSFWSGHSTNAFTAASLICVEHDALDLYGGKRDAPACGAALAIAAVAGASRITSNNHHASDVIVGAAVGGLLGYWMPKLLHFRTRKEPKLGWLMPSVSPAGGGLTYVLAW